MVQILKVDSHIVKIKLKRRISLSRCLQEVLHQFVCDVFIFFVTAATLGLSSHTYSSGEIGLSRDSHSHEEARRWNLLRCV
jgi:hypothetical protein